jgi:branched-chain amino acid transport system substrate-binding protein
VWWATTRTGPDVGSNIARQWLDRDGVDMIVDVPTLGGAGRARASRARRTGPHQLIRATAT